MAGEYDGLETLGGAAKRTNKAAMDFAQALDDSNETLIGIQENYQAKKTTMLDQANALAAQSDQLAIDQARAIADPWHEMKVLFTDEKSVADIVVDQNIVQSKMNKLQRDNQQVVYEYQFRLGQVQQNLTELENRRKYGREDTAAIAAQDVAKQGQMQRQKTERMTHLQSLSYNELLALRPEVASGKNTRVRDQELEEVIRWWEGAGKRAKGKSALDQKKEYWSFIPDHIVNGAVRTGKGFTFQTPDGILNYSAEEAVHVQHQQTKDRAEMAKTATDTAANVADAAWQREYFAETTERYANSLDIDIFKSVTDPNNPARSISVIDYKKLPSDNPAQLAELQRMDEMIAERERRILEEGPDGVFAGMDDNKPSSKRSLNLQAEVNELMVKRQTLLTELVKPMVADMQSMYATDGAKETTKQYLLKGRVIPSENSRIAMTEVLMNDASIASSYSSLAPGWNEAAYSIQDSLLTGFDKATSATGADKILSVFDADATEEEKKVGLASLLAGNDKKKAINVEMEALQEMITEPSGRKVNKHQNILFKRWNNQAMNFGLQALLAKHANEPITQQAIRSVMEGERGMAQKYLVDIAGVKKLMYDLSKASSAMHKQGSLPPEVNLAFELESQLRDPDFLNGNKIRSMTEPQEHTSALIAAELFNNRQHSAFITTFDAQIGALHLQDIDAAKAEQLAEDIAKQKYGHTGRAITHDQYLESLDMAYKLITKQTEKKQQGK